MADVSHSWGYLKAIPVTGSSITLDSQGAALGSTYRIIGPLNYESTYRNKNEDINESGVLVGERRFDYQETLGFSLQVPSAFSNTADLTPGSKVTLASVTPSLYNGDWQIETCSHSYTQDAAAVFAISLRRNAGFTPTAQNPS